MLRKFRGQLLWQFAFTSLAAVLALGLALGWLIGYVIERDALDDAAAEATQTLSLRVLRRLSSTDFAVPMRGQRYAEFDQFVEEQVLSGRTARIKIWSKDGTVLYSDDESQIGQSFPVKDELAEALHGGVATEVSDLHDSENADERHFGRLLEVYAPVVFAGSSDVAGAFEIYQFYEPVAAYVESVQRSLYASLAVGLVLLYLALFSLVKSGHDTIRHQQGQLAALYRTGQNLRSTLDLSQVLRNIIADATTLARGQGGVLMLLDSQKKELTAASTYNVPLEAIALRGPVQVGQGFPCKVLLEGRSMLLPDDLPLPAIPIAPALSRARSSICVPLSYRDRATGVICIDHYSNAHAFSRHDVSLVEELAGQAAIAIEQAEAFAREGDLRSQLQTVNEAALAVGSEFSLQGLVRRIVDLARGLTGARYGALGILDAEGEFKHFVTTGLDERGGYRSAAEVCGTSRLAPSRE